MEYKDYYKALGINKTASQKEVQAAYRKLARKLHPDVNKSPDAEDRFKEINEAYEVLKDTEKRKRYDTLGANWREGQGGTPPPGWENAHFDFSDGMGGFAFQGGNAGQFSDFFEGLFGRGRARTYAGQDMQGWAMRGQDQESDIELTLEEAYHGVKKSIRLQSMEPEGDSYVPKSKEINVNIPAGVMEGKRIRLSGQGAPGIGGGPNGDLYLKVHILPNNIFTVNGSDLEEEVLLSPWEAALGAKVEITTMTGKVNLTIPAGVQSGQKLRLRGKGMPIGRSGHGDLYAIMKIVVPKNLSKEERKLFEELSRVSSYNPRSGGKEA